MNFQNTSAINQGSRRFREQAFGAMNWRSGGKGPPVFIQFFIMRYTFLILLLLLGAAPMSAQTYYAHRQRQEHLYPKRTASKLRHLADSLRSRFLRCPSTAPVRAI